MKKFFSSLFGTNEIDTKHVGVLDGVRALSVFIVAAFHFWQQSWLWNLWDTKKLQWLGVDDFGMNYIFSTGYEFVDMMILLTGFCLFLPYARLIVERNGEKGKLPSVPDFYVRRIARIWPSYYFCLAVFLIFFIRVGDYYGGVSGFLKDLIPHLTFTQTAFYESYLGTKFTGVLWTLSIEMAFYVLFPLLAYLFYKKPAITYLTMNGISLVFYIWIMKNHASDLQFYFNRFPTFLCVFANGMLAAVCFVTLAKNIKQNKYTGLIFTVGAAGALYFIRLLLKYELAYSSAGQKWQIQNRFGMSLLFSAFIICLGFSYNIVRWIFSNPVTRFLSKISFNFYIWHQFLACHIKEHKFPYWESASGMPQADGNVAWQWKYTIAMWVVSLGVATIVTYLIEIPCHKLIMKGYGKIKTKIADKKSENKKENSYGQ